MRTTLHIAKTGAKRPTTLCGGRNIFLKTISLKDYLDPHIIMARDTEVCYLCVKKISPLEILANTEV